MIGNKSFSLGYELLVNGTVFAKGRSVLVAYDGIDQVSMPIHDKIRTALEKLKK